MIEIKVRLILEDEGKILLLRQTNRNGGSYTLIGGRVEDREFAIEGLIRETFEESNILLRAENLELVHVLHKKKAITSRVILYFKAKHWEGSPLAREKKKFQDVEWFSLDALPYNISTTVLQVLDNYRKNIAYSEFLEVKTKKG